VQRSGGTAGVAASRVGGGVQEQPGEQLDRLGLLHASEASKPRTAEPTLVVVQNNLLDRKGTSVALRERLTARQPARQKTSPHTRQGSKPVVLRQCKNALPPRDVTRTVAEPAGNDAGRRRQPSGQPGRGRPPGPAQVKRMLCPLSRPCRESLTTPTQHQERAVVVRYRGQSKQTQTGPGGRQQQSEKSTRASEREKRRRAGLVGC
jgi:hypothetical protein